MLIQALYCGMQPVGAGGLVMHVRPVVCVLHTEHSIPLESTAQTRTDTCNGLVVHRARPHGGEGSMAQCGQGEGSIFTVFLRKSFMDDP